MEIVLNLSQTEIGLLRALCPRGNARKGNYLENTAHTLLVASMRREARLRRIGLDQVGVVALCEAVARKAER